MIPGGEAGDLDGDDSHAIIWPVRYIVRLVNPASMTMSRNFLSRRGCDIGNVQVVLQGSGQW